MLERDDAVNLDHLLKELHSKRRWLDMMIAGLEAALESPHHKLIQTVTRSFGNGHIKGPIADLHWQGQARMARLAEEAARGAGRRRKAQAQSA